MSESTLPTLYEWAGGTPEIFEHLTTVFYDKVLRDELLYPVFKDMSPEHTKHVAHFIAEVFGGPKLYTGTDGGSHPSMSARHFGKMLDDTKRKRWVQLLLEAADETGLPADPEFRSAFVAYLEWGSRIAVLNSEKPLGADPGNAPMPAWGWGETKGPYRP